MRAIEGMYRWGEDIVRIERAPADEWQTLYSSGAESGAQRLRMFTQLYHVHLPHECTGICLFDGNTLDGGYASKWLLDAMAGNAPIRLSVAQAKQEQGKLRQGKITATLRPDGNFDVVIVSDLLPPPNTRPIDLKTFKPDHERTEANWVRI